jgi:nucleoside-diphosphate-sugar epimerase
MTKLVTGGTGKVGLSAVKSLVERGYDARCLARTSSPRFPKLQQFAVKPVEGTLQEREAVRKPVEGVDSIII